MFDDSVDLVLSKSCIELESRCQLNFIEIGTDKDHLYFLVLSVPSYSVTKILTINNLRIMKSKIVRNMFKICYYVKKRYLITLNTPLLTAG
ncbi:transposase [Allofrancisella guangzhouensis]|uniref:transposase n=1 Tax=Allofrancisella guangzhouensis TaxID=594679 RepID=UPI003899308F